MLRNWRLFFTLALGGAVALPIFGQEVKSPEALALLHGVLSARNDIDPLRAELLLRFEVSGNETTFHLTVDQQGDKRRVEQLNGSIEPVSYLVEGDIVSGYRRKANEDFQIYGIHRSGSIRGDMAFDPRIVGLSDMPSVDDSLTNSLWVDRCESARVLEDGIIGGVSCRRVEANIENIVSEFWISDSSFRLYRRVFTYSGGTLQIDSQYEGADSDRVLPTSVFAKRVEGGDTVREMTLTVKSLEVNVPIPPERFTTQSFNLPINTMRNDYRISRITGYWNGLEFTENPVSAERLPPPAPLKPTTVAAVPRSRTWLIVLNAMALIALGGYAWRRSRVRTR